MYRNLVILVTNYKFFKKFLILQYVKYVCKPFTKATHNFAPPPPKKPTSIRVGHARENGQQSASEGKKSALLLHHDIMHSQLRSLRF